MFGMKIQMDEEKILREDVHNLVKVYNALDQTFAQFGLVKGETEADGTRTYWGTNKNTDFGSFCSVSTMLKVVEVWFLPNCKKWLWGDDEVNGDGTWDWEDVLEQERNGQ